MTRLLFGIVLCFITFCTKAQILLIDDSFDDGDFTNNPTWSGRHSIKNEVPLVPFEIDGADNQLRSPDTEGGGRYRFSYLSTMLPSDVDYASGDATWRFRMKLGFTVSGKSAPTNHARVYLMSDVADLFGNVNGYYIRFSNVTGNSPEVRLFRQAGDNTSSTKISLDGRLQSFASRSFVDVEVTRSASGVWEVLVNKSSQGTGTDDTHTTGRYFGVQIRYTANGRSNQFFFDDFNVSFDPTLDTFPPTLESVNATSATSVIVNFSEEVEGNNAGEKSNYVIDGAAIASAVPDNDDARRVTLTLAPLTNGQSYTLTVNKIEDLSGNAIADNASASFRYLVFGKPEERSIVINEFIVDPSPPVGLPNAEFVELFNPTDQYFNLTNFIIEEISSSSGSLSSSGAFPDFTLAPGAYVIVTDTDDADLFNGFGDVLGVSRLPDFNETNSSVILKDGNGDVIDEVWYAEEPPLNGVSFEQINPHLPCGGTFNFSASANSDGGTPGVQNAVFNDAPDTQKPSVTAIKVVDADSIQVTFSEPLDEASVTSSDFSLSGFQITSVNMWNDLVAAVRLGADLVSETPYILGISKIQDCSGNVIEETSEGFLYDNTPPVLEQIIIASNRSVSLKFNEELNERTAENENNFSLDQGIGEPSRNTLQSPKHILLAFDTDFSAGTTYRLSYAGVEDLTGNAAGSSSDDFTYEEGILAVRVVAPNVIDVVFREAVTPSSANDIVQLSGGGCRQSRCRCAHR